MLQKKGNYKMAGDWKLGEYVILQNRNTYYWLRYCYYYQPPVLMLIRAKCFVNKEMDCLFIDDWKELAKSEGYTSLAQVKRERDALPQWDKTTYYWEWKEPLIYRYCKTGRKVSKKRVQQLDAIGKAQNEKQEEHLHNHSRYKVGDRVMWLDEIDAGWEHPYPPFGVVVSIIQPEEPREAKFYYVQWFDGNDVSLAVMAAREREDKNKKYPPWNWFFPARKLKKCDRKCPKCPVRFQCYTASNMLSSNEE